MKTRNLLWAGLIGLIVVLFGCKKDKDLFAPNVDRAKVEIEERDDSFFSGHILQELGENFTPGGITTYHSEFSKNLIQDSEFSSPLRDSITNKLGLPCWECGEVEQSLIYGSYFIYLPVFSTDGFYSLNGIIIIEQFLNGYSLFYVIDESFLSEGNSNYWQGIFDFFQSKVEGKSPDGNAYFNNRVLGCYRSGSTSRCICSSGITCPGVGSEGFEIDDCHNYFCDGTSNDGNGGSNNDEPNGDVGNEIDDVVNWWLNNADNWGINGTGSSGAGGGATIDNPVLDFNGNFFLPAFLEGNIMDYLIAKEINRIRDRFQIYHITALQLLSRLQNNCGYTGYLEFKNISYFTPNDMPDCIKAILEETALYLLENTDGLILNTNELIDIFGNNVYNTSFPAGRKSTLIQYLKGVIGFGSNAETWLNSYGRPMSFTAEFYKFLRNEEFSTEATMTLSSVFGFLHEKSFDESSSAAVEAVVSLLASDKLRGPYTDTERDAIVLDHFSNDPDFYIEYITQCLLLRHEYEQNNPGQECGLLCEAQIALEAFWRVKSGMVHTALDICGLVPFAGEPCDLVNGTLYILEGDGVNATISFAGSIPFLGWGATGVKFASVIIAIPSGIEKTLTITKQGGKYVFSHKSQFRQMLGITDPDKQAHHLVAWASREHDVVQKAADAASSPFHMNHPKNGLGVEKWRNQPNHNNYNSQVAAALDQIKANLESIHGKVLDDIDPNLVSTELKSFQDYLRNLVSSNPNSHLDDLIINYP